MLNIELSPNLEYLITLPGFGKLLTLIFGAVTIGLGGHAKEDEIELWKEKLFLFSTVSCFVVSFFYLLAFCFSDQLVCSKVNKIIDILYHAASGLLEIVVGSLMLDSSAELRGTGGPCHIPSLGYCLYFEEKIGAGIFAILCGVIYFATSAAIYKVRGL